MTPQSEEETEPLFCSWRSLESNVIGNLGSLGSMEDESLPIIHVEGKERNDLTPNPKAASPIEEQDGFSGWYFQGK